MDYNLKDIRKILGENRQPHTCTLGLTQTNKKEHDNIRIWMMMTMMIRVVKTACSASGTMPRKITKPKGEKMMIGSDVHGESMYIVIIIDEH